MYPTVTINGVTIEDQREVTPFWIEIKEQPFRYVSIQRFEKQLIIASKYNFLYIEEARRYSDELLQAIDTIEQIYQHFEKIGKPL